MKLTLTLRLLLASVVTCTIYGIYYVKSTGLTREKVKAEQLNKNGLPPTMSLEPLPKVLPTLDTAMLNKCQEFITFRDSTAIPDSIKIMIFKHLEKEKLPYSKTLYLNFLCYIFRVEDHLSYEEDEYLQFRDKDVTLQFCKNNVKPKKLNNFYYMRIDYGKIGHSSSRGRDYMIFDKKGNIKSRFEHFEGNHDSGDDKHIEEIRDWNGDGDDEVVVNFHDARRFYNAEVEYVFSYDEEKDTMRQIFVFDKMFTGSEEPKCGECDRKGFQPIDFRDVASYQFITPDSILAHFKYSRTNTKTKREIIEEEYDFGITRQKDGFYLNPNNSEAFWLKRRANNEIFYNPHCGNCDKQQIPYLSPSYEYFYQNLPAKWKKKKYFK